MTCTNRKTAGLLAVLTLVGTAACSDGAMDIDRQFALMAGSYSAEGSFGAMDLTTREDGSEVTVDWLAEGASILLDLHEDGTTSGNLFVPGADEDGGDIDEDLVGTWSVSNEGGVTFEHEADTFVRDMPFLYEHGRLTGDETFGSMSMHVELLRR